MPTTYTPNAANNPGDITLPSDLDPATAESINAALRALGDKSAFAIATRAALAAVNTFTRGQVIEPTDESEALIASERYPGSITADNRWALVARFRYDEDRAFRIFTGGLGGIGRLALTLNARWSVANQEWFLEDDDGDAAAILWKADALTLHHVAAGTSPFLHWPSTGSAAFRATGEFRYTQTKTRIRTIPVTSAAGSVGYNGASGAANAAVLGVQDFIRWPIRLPPEAILQKVEVLHRIDSSATEKFRITRRRTTWDPFDTTIPTETILTEVDSDSSPGDHITTITVSAAVDRSDEICLLWVPSAILFNEVYAIRVEWADQGPTPI